MAMPLARALLGLAALLGGACAADSARPPRIQVDPAAQPALVSAPFGDLVEQWIDAPGSLFVRRPRPDLGAYRALRYERPAIFYERSVAAPLVSDHSFLTRALESAIRAELALSIPLAETQQGGDGVLRVSSEITDLDFDRSKASNSRVTSIVEPGRTATFVLQLTDDASGTPLVRVAMRRPMPGGIFTGPWSADIDRSVQLFRSFAKDTRASLAHVVRPLGAPD